jgi:hypothetical protein
VPQGKVGSAEEKVGNFGRIVPEVLGKERNATNLPRFSQRVTILVDKKGVEVEVLATTSSVRNIRTVRTSFSLTPRDSLKKRHIEN